MVVQLRCFIKKAFSIGEKGVSPSVLQSSTHSVSQGTEVTLVTEYEFCSELLKKAFSTYKDKLFCSRCSVRNLSSV